MATKNDRVGLLSWEMQINVKGFENKIKDSAQSLQKLDKKGTKGLKRVSKGFSMASVAAGVFAVSLTRLVSESIAVATAYDRVDKAMNTVFGDEATSQMQFVTDLSDKLGLSIRSASFEYAKLSAAAKGTIIEGKGVEEVFKGVSEASTALGLSTDETSGAFLAISQIISKGKVQADELRGQLGERIPGAFQIAARAMNMTTIELDKFMEQGKLTSDEFIPRFAEQLRKEFAGAATEAADSITANTNRMKNAWEGSLKGMGKVAADFFPLVTKGLNQFNEGVEEAFAQRNRLLGIGEFAPGADDYFGKAATRAEIEAKMTEKQRERMRLNLMTKEEREAEVKAAKQLLKEEKNLKGLKSFSELGVGLQYKQISEDIRKEARLTAKEYEALQPAIEKALKGGVEKGEIVKEAQAMARLFGDEMNKGAKADLSMLDDIDKAQKGIEREQAEAANKRRRAEMEFLKKKIAMQDPRRFAQRAMAGSIEEYKILIGQDNTAKKSEQHLNAMKKHLVKLESV